MNTFYFNWLLEFWKRSWENKEGYVLGNEEDDKPSKPITESDVRDFNYHLTN